MPWWYETLVRLGDAIFASPPTQDWLVNELLPLIWNIYEALGGAC